MKIDTPERVTDSKLGALNRYPLDYHGFLLRWAGHSKPGPLFLLSSPKICIPVLRDIYSLCRPREGYVRVWLSLTSRGQGRAAMLLFFERFLCGARASRLRH